MAVGWIPFAICAPGASISETVPYTIFAPIGGSQPAQTVIVSTPQFNPALGTLNDAATAITGTVDTALEFFSTGPGGSYDILLTDTLTLQGIPGQFGEELTGVLPANQPVFTAPVTLPFRVDRGDPPELVVGSGVWSQLFSLPAPSIRVNQSPASVLVPGLKISGLSVTTYSYTPAVTPVPEPRLLVPVFLLPGGLGAWAWRSMRIPRRR